MPPRRRRKLPGDPAKGVAYIRVSTSEQRLGPEAQRDAIRLWCAREGIELVTLHQDLGVSGGADLEDRPGLLMALDDLVTHGAGVLVVAKRDRLARDVGNAAMIERLVGRAGGEIRCADGNGNGNGPAAMLTKGLLDLFAAHERAVIKARTKAALATKKARGERVGSIPYGYRLDSDGKRLIVDEHEQEIVKLVKLLRGEGATLMSIGQELSERGYTPRGRGRWHPDTISRIAKAEEPHSLPVRP
jgi:site-specific DNA recombinase